MLQKLHSLFFHELQIITALFAILISGEAQGSSAMCGISLVSRIFHFQFCFIFVIVYIVRQQKAHSLTLKCYDFFQN